MLFSSLGWFCRPTSASQSAELDPLLGRDRLSVGNARIRPLVGSR